MVMEPLPPSGATGGPAAGSRNMEPAAQLNPHFLGREFVRQYYTVLNQSPSSLYRFYAEDSSLVHGSLNRNEESEPVHGQAEIQRRIIGLNFRDCHAKIRQVDSLETMERGVVVQVTGELSNSGMPMRRFFQTFVLAPRSPTNYYVRNDIFRYQDDVFFDEEESAEPEKADLELGEKAVIESTIPAPKVAVEPAKHVNGHPEIKQLPSDQPPVQKEVKTAAAVAVRAASAKLPGTWASRVADSGAAVTAVAQVAPQENIAIAEATLASVIPAAVPEPDSTSPKVLKDQRRPNRPKTKSEKSDTQPDSGTSVADSAESLVDEKKPAVVYGDEQQVFVGNLPQDITEDELRMFFSKYGNIVDVRINRTNAKASAGRTPNYGFVTFDDTRIVKSILSQKPIYFNEHRFNVEEKRSQGRGNLFRSPSGGGLNMNRGMNSFVDSKMQRMQRPERKEWPRDNRPYGERNERSFGERGDRPVTEHSGLYPARKVVTGSTERVGGGQPAGGAAGAPLRNSFSNSNNFHSSNHHHPQNHNNKR